MNKILVVEDDAVTLYGLERILAKEGYVVELAENGNIGIEKLKNDSFDIVLTDLKMPGIDGIGILKKAREISPKTAVIMITGFATIQNAVEAMKQGAKDYITKPFDPKDLIKSIKTVAEELEFNSGKIINDLKKSITPEEIGAVLEALANPVRRKVLELLNEKKWSYTSLAEELQIGDPTKLSYHLRLLKAAALIEQDEEKIYLLSARGKKVIEALKRI